MEVVIKRESPCGSIPQCAWTGSLGHGRDNPALAAPSLISQPALTWSQCRALVPLGPRGCYYPQRDDMRGHSIRKELQAEGALRPIFEYRSSHTLSPQFFLYLLNLRRSPGGWGGGSGRGSMGTDVQCPPPFPARPPPMSTVAVFPVRTLTVSPLFGIQRV